MQEDQYMNARTAAAYAGMSYLQFMRIATDGEGPIISMRQECPCYAKKDLDNWLKENDIVVTHDLLGKGTIIRK